MTPEQHDGTDSGIGGAADMASEAQSGTADAVRVVALRLPDFRRLDNRRRADRRSHLSAATESEQGMTMQRFDLRHAFAFALFSIALFCAGCLVLARAQEVSIGCGVYGVYKPSGGASCTATPALDGTAQIGHSNNTTTPVLSLTTTGTSDVWIYFVGASVSTSSTLSVSSAHLTWNPIPGTTSSGAFNSGAGQAAYAFYAVATSALTSESVSGTLSVSSSYNEAQLFAISGAATSSSFDRNAGTSNTATAPAITTAQGNDFVAASLWNGSTSATAGSGWTALIGGAASSLFSFSEYQSPNPSGTGTFTANQGGSPGQNAGLAYAIKCL